MAVKLVLLLTVAGLLASAEARSAPKITSKSLIRPWNDPRPGGLDIYDGSKTNIKKCPYLAALISGGQFQCASTILNHRWVITLGGCVLGSTITGLEINVGSNYDDGYHGTLYAVSQLIIHPKFVEDDYNYDYDYALVQSAGTFKFSNSIKPAKLPSADPKAGTKMLVVGWGEDYEYSVEEEPEVGDPPDVLRKGTMMWTSQATCQAVFGDVNLPWTNRFACASNNGKTTLCDYDWGDPFVTGGVLYGMFSAGVSDGFCTSQAQPVILSDILTVKSWIQESISSDVLATSSE